MDSGNLKTHPGREGNKIALHFFLACRDIDSNFGEGISEGCFIIDFALLPLEVTHTI